MAKTFTYVGGEFIDLDAAVRIKPNSHILRPDASVRSKEDKWAKDAVRITFVNSSESLDLFDADAKVVLAIVDPKGLSAPKAATAPASITPTAAAVTPVPTPAPAATSTAKS